MIVNGIPSAERPVNAIELAGPLDRKDGTHATHGMVFDAHLRAGRRTR